MLSLPAIAEEVQHFEYETLAGTQYVTRQIGDVLHPERESLPVLMAIKQSLGEYNFGGQYQQSPAPLGSGIFKHDWLRYYSPHECPAKFDGVIQSWDTASKETELADYSVCTTWGIKGKYRYLLNVVRGRMDFPALKRTVIQQIERMKPTIVLIEDKASGIQLIQELRSMGHSTIKEFKPKGDKVMRAVAQTAAFEGGFVLLPQQAEWLDSYMSEMQTFPRGKYDDQVDSTTQALSWIAEYGIESGIYAYYRMMSEENSTRL